MANNSNNVSQNIKTLADGIRRKREAKGINASFFRKETRDSLFKPLEKAYGVEDVRRSLIKKMGSKYKTPEEIKKYLRDLNPGQEKASTRTILDRTVRDYKKVYNNKYIPKDFVEAKRITNRNVRLVTEPELAARATEIGDSLGFHRRKTVAQSINNPTNLQTLGKAPTTSLGEAAKTSALGGVKQSKAGITPGTANNSGFANQGKIGGNLPPSGPFRPGGGVRPIGL